MQAITTKFLGPTNTRDGRCKASCEAGSITIPADHSKSYERLHTEVARALVHKLNWLPSEGRAYAGVWHGGFLPNGNAVFVFVSTQGNYLGFEIEAAP